MRPDGDQVERLKRERAERHTTRRNRIEATTSRCARRQAAVNVGTEILVAISFVSCTPTRHSDLLLRNQEPIPEMCFVG